MASAVLTDLIKQFPGTPLANKATTLMDVLSRQSTDRRRITQYGYHTSTGRQRDTATGN